MSTTASKLTEAESLAKSNPSKAEKIYKDILSTAGALQDVKML
jgi:hypothetical protein